MPIEKTLERIAVALERIADNTTGNAVTVGATTTIEGIGDVALTENKPAKAPKPKKAPKPAETTPEEPTEEPTAEEPTITYDDMRKLGKKVLELKKGKILKEAIRERGAENLGLLDKKYYPELHKLMQDIINE